MEDRTVAEREEAIERAGVGKGVSAHGTPSQALERVETGAGWLEETQPAAIACPRRWSVEIPGRLGLGGSVNSIKDVFTHQLNSTFNVCCI